MIALIQLVFWILVICVALAYWQWAVGLVVLWVAFKIWKGMQQQNEETEKELTKAQAHFNDAMRLINGVRMRKNVEEPIAALKRAEKELLEANIYDPDGERVNTSKAFDLLDAVKAVYPVDQFLLVAHRAEFKKDEQSAINAYRDALYEIENSGVLDYRFELAETKFKGTRTLVTTAEIRKRAAL